MHETRAPTDEKIRAQVLKEYREGTGPKALADKTGISVNTIKSWIKREKAKECKQGKSAPAKKEGAPPKRKKGAPVGNQNAKGNGALPRNKNAEKHGAYSQIYWDSLDEQEAELLASIPAGEEFQLQQQLNMYTIRERRLMHRISELQKKTDKSKGLYVKAIKKRKRICIGEDGNPQEMYEDTSTETEYQLKALMTLEAELTKVQRAKNKTIDSMIRLRAEKEKYDELMLGWQKKQEIVSEDDNEDDEGVILYLPNNGRD